MMNTTPKTTTKQAFEWVKTGVWTLNVFNMWLENRSSFDWETGYNTGFEDGADAYKKQS